MINRRGDPIIDATKLSMMLFILIAAMTAMCLITVGPSGLGGVLVISVFLLLACCLKGDNNCGPGGDAGGG